MFSHTFPARELQFLPYKPPLEPKKKMSKKAVHSDLGEILGTKPESIIGEEGRAIPAPTTPGVEAIDLTCLVSEGNCGLSDDEGRVSSDISCDATFSLKIDHQSVRSEEFIGKQISRGNTSNERSSQPVPLWDSRQKNAAATEHSRTGSDTTASGKDCPLEDHIGTQTGDRLEATGTSNPDRHDGERSTGIEDATNSVAVGELGSQASGPTHCEPAPMQATANDSLPLSICDSNGEGVIHFANSPPTANLKQATHGGGSDSLLETTTHQRQLPMHKMVKGTGKTSIVIEVSSGSSDNGSDGDTDGNKSLTPPPPTRKRKRMALFRNKGRFSNHSSSASLLPATQQSGYDTYNKHGSTSSNRGGYKSKKRRKFTPRPQTNDDVEHIEYEVEKIVSARIYEGKLEYRAKWVGHEDDPKWYNASNFKNSPLILRDFHEDNPTHPGPPRRLDVWILCWKNTADHPDDDKPRDHT